MGSGGVSVRAAAVVVTDWAGFGEEGQRGWSIDILCASWAALLAIVGLFSGFVVFLLCLVLHISSLCVVISLLATRKHYLKWIRVPGQIASGFVFGRRSFQRIWRSYLFSLSLSLSLSLCDCFAARFSHVAFKPFMITECYKPDCPNCWKHLLAVVLCSWNLKFIMRRTLHVMGLARKEVMGLGGAWTWSEMLTKNGVMVTGTLCHSWCSMSALRQLCQRFSFSLSSGILCTIVLAKL